MTTITSTDQFCDAVLPSARAMLWFADKVTADIPAEKFARMPDGVNTNHPAFVIGHLALYPGKMLQLLGLPAEDADEQEEALFEAGVACRDDVDGTVYPKKAELLSRFMSRHEALLAAIPTVTQTALAAPNPHESMRDMFPTAGAMVSFMLGMHAAVHLGQVSAWRRCFGLPSCMG